MLSYRTAYKICGLFGATLIQDGLKVSATLQDRPRADRSSACVLNKNPYKLHIF